MADEADDDQPVSAPFSAHARGVPLSVSENFEFGSNIESGLLQLLDITGAGIHLILANGWLTVIQIVITIACTSFYSYLGVFSVQADLDFSILSFAVLLPLVLAVFRSIQRRDTALKELAAGACRMHKQEQAHTAITVPPCMLSNSRCLMRFCRGCALMSEPCTASLRMRLAHGVHVDQARLRMCGHAPMRLTPDWHILCFACTSPASSGIISSCCSTAASTAQGRELHAADRRLGCAVKTLIIHYKLLSDGALDPASLPASHESQLEGLLSNLIGVPEDQHVTRKLCP